MFDLRTLLEKRPLVFPNCACCGLALTTIMSFSFSWSQSCRSPTCLCSWTSCMSWTSLMVLFLQRKQIPLLTQGPPQSSVDLYMIKSTIYLRGFASMCKLLRKSTRVNVSKCLMENIFTKMNPVKLWLEKLDSCTKALISDYCSILTLFSNCLWGTNRQTVENFDEKEWYWCSKEAGWSAFRVRKVLSFIYRIDPLTPLTPSPCSSMSRLPSWCWCHFSNASMGTGICMAPRLPTNSSFNTCAERLICHSGFKSLAVSVFVHKMTN